MGQAAGHKLEDVYYMQKVQLGHGSYGTVWRGVHKQSGKVVAVKQIEKASLPQRGVKRADIDREIGVMRVLRQENIVQLADTFEDQLYISLVIEYCDGGDFGDKILERGMDISEIEVAWWVRQMCSAVAFMHTKWICHRDIKPENFLISQGAMLKLADLGLAVTVQPGQLIRDKCGTPAFMAPEQHDDGKDTKPGYGLPCDVWALGITMYAVMFGGQHPFLDARGTLDMPSLLEGKLDFRDRSGLGRIRPGALRFSDLARKLCKQMVTKDTTMRVAASVALGSSWFDIAKGDAARAKVDSSMGSSRKSGGRCCCWKKPNKADAAASVPISEPPPAPAKPPPPSPRPRPPAQHSHQSSTGTGAATTRSSQPPLSPRSPRNPHATSRRPSGSRNSSRANSPAISPMASRETTRSQQGEGAHVTGVSSWGSWLQAIAPVAGEASSASQGGAIWEYNLRGEYQAFQPECCEAIEAQYTAYRAGTGPRIGRVMSMGRPVLIDFGNMRQRVEGSASKRDREVRRRSR